MRTKIILADRVMVIILVCHISYTPLKVANKWIYESGYHPICNVIHQNTGLFVALQIHWEYPTEIVLLETWDLLPSILSFQRVKISWGYRKLNPYEETRRGFHIDLNGWMESSRSPWPPTQSGRIVAVCENQRCHLEIEMSISFLLAFPSLLHYDW